MKAVMLSVRPKWCEKIANKEKTLEIRRSMPKILTPFKCYIYCTKDRYHTLFKDWIDPPFVTKEYNIMNGKGVKNVFSDNRPWGKANGKVIGEFICDHITMSITGQNNEPAYWSIVDGSCLTIRELILYGELKTLYGWHISALKIYDKPMELGEFGLSRAPQSWRYVPERISKEDTEGERG